MDARDGIRKSPVGQRVGPVDEVQPVQKRLVILAAPAEPSAGLSKTSAFWHSREDDGGLGERRVREEVLQGVKRVRLIPRRLVHANHPEASACSQSGKVIYRAA